MLILVPRKQIETVKRKLCPIADPFMSDARLHSTRSAVIGSTRQARRDGR
jgi:hypothetical protein